MVAVSSSDGSLWLLQGCQLGPGTYNFRSSTQQTLDHVVGNLAPFDQLSAVRSKPLKTGHYAKAVSPTLTRGQYDYFFNVRVVEYKYNYSKKCNRVRVRLLLEVIMTIMMNIFSPKCSAIVKING